MDEKEFVEEGGIYDLRVNAKGARGEGIGRIGSLVVFVNNAKTRIGNNYKVKVTKVHRTFAYAELNGGMREIIGNGSQLEF
ncbi:MAG: TRAM domain-containing protein [Candidatus Marsarchaeota archaeon]|jgi:predicted RNA-binding protein with TRAM domain|nr:TRAM domain-containing protein [Candidatus Marsarchaeota archaeon]MCL5111854.1 TRAM domain-containing protein [Candidatus Marsarchaeota archaeon]